MQVRHGIGWATLCASTLVLFGSTRAIVAGEQPSCRNAGKQVQYDPAAALSPSPSNALVVSSSGGFAASGVTLLSRIPISDFPGSAVGANDVWGYVSPSGREYGILGLVSGTGFVDLTDPTAPIVIARIADESSTWSDMATFGTFAYNVNESGGGIQIIDLSRIDDGIVTLAGIVQGGVDTAHNIAVNEESGFAYACGANHSNGFIVFDLTDPSDPVEVGFWGDTSVHDVYATSYDDCPYAGRQGPCEIVFVFAGGSGIRIVDVTDKSNMTTVASYTYPGLRYCHQGWPSADKRFLFYGDELDELNFGFTARTFAINIEDLANPFAVTNFTTGLNTIDHNLMVRGDFVLEANYSSGLAIFDASNLSSTNKPTLAGFFDTWPPDDSRNFIGAWGIYTGLPSGIVLISDEENGLFVLDVLATVGCVTDTHCNDRNPCTQDTCGVGGVCENAFVAAQVACDDGNLCSINGVCDGAGNCVSTDVNTIPCVDDTVCGFGSCDGASGLCSCVPCVTAERPGDTAFVTAKNRFLSMVPANLGVFTAIRVILTGLPEEFAALTGTEMWVGAPFPVNRFPGNNGPDEPNFMVARLGCQPSFQDWGAIGEIQVFGDAVVPGASYLVQAVIATCFNAGISQFSAPFVVETSLWGDLVGDCTSTPCSPPEGIINITTDLVAQLDSFSDLPGSVNKFRADIEPRVPDFLINITDIVATQNAFSGFAYPFEGPTGCP